MQVLVGWVFGFFLGNCSFKAAQRFKMGKKWEKTFKVYIFLYTSQIFCMPDAFTVPGCVVKLYWTGTEVSECSADGKNTESYKCIPNLMRRQGDIYHTTSNRHTVIGSPAPTVRQRKNSGWVQKKICQRQTLKTFIMGCLQQSASNASQPVLALSMRLTGRAWLNWEASASAKRAEI